jgi:hypothetical protein
MTTTTSKPTPAQLEVLKRAMTKGYYGDKPEGRLMLHGFSMPTLGILVERGWVEKYKFVRDPQQRHDLVTSFEGCLADAKSSLDAGDWRKALDALETADDIQTTSAREYYWITDAGKAALEGK